MHINFNQFLRALFRKVGFVKFGNETFSHFTKLKSIKPLF